jgi:AcrR family transcriptional regulator
MIRQWPGCPPGIQELAGSTGLSRRAIYNHFAGPDDIYRAVFKDYLRVATEGAQLEISRTLPPAQAIDGFATSVLELIASEPYLMILRALAGGPTDEWLASAFRRTVRQPLARSVEAYLLYRRLPCSGIDPADAAEHLIATAEATVISRLLIRRDPLEGWELEFQARLIAQAFRAAYCSIPLSS